MPATFAKVVSNTASVTFSYGDDSITVVYYPAKVTEKVFRLVNAFEGVLSNMTGDNFEQGFQALNGILAGLPSQPGTGIIKSWDLYEDEAQTTMYPLDCDHLADLPIFFRATVLRAVLGDMRPNTMAPQMSQTRN